MNSSLQVKEFAHRIALIREGKPVYPSDLHQVIKALKEKKVSQNLVLNLIEARGILRLTKFLEDRTSKNIRKISAKLICELMHNNPKGQVTYSESFAFSSFSGMCTINQMPIGMVDYLKRNPSGFSTLKNMDKYFEQKENTRSSEQTVFWCFPPMRKRTSSEKRKFKEQVRANSRIDDENLNDSEINEKHKVEIENELEEDYMDFPDPLEYLIGFFATKPDNSYRYQTTSFQQTTVKGTKSPAQKPPMVHSNQDPASSEPRQLYTSYYDYKKHSQADTSNLINSYGCSSTYNPSSNKSKYSGHNSLLNSAQKANIFAKNKVSMDHQKQLFSKTIDHENRLCRTLGEEDMLDSRQNSIGRDSAEPYDPFSEHKSYTGSASKFNDTGSYLSAHLNKKHQNKYSGSSIKGSKLTYDTSQIQANNSQNLNYTASNPVHEENADISEREITEREPVYAGIISAGSGSVSSTKIKKEIEGKKRKKFKKIEYLSKAPAGSSHKASLTQYQRKYKFTPATVVNSSRTGKQPKPPLSTNNAAIISNGAPTYKYSRSRVEGLDSSRGYNSTASYNSSERSEQKKGDPSVRNYIKEPKKSVAAKLSATLPKSSGYKKFGSSSNYKSHIQHKKQTSGQRIKVYSNSSRESKKGHYSSGVHYPGTTKHYESPSGLKTGKYARIPKSIPKSNPNLNTNTDGNAVHIRTFECSTSPFRTDLSGSGSVKRTSYLNYKGSARPGLTTSFGGRPVSNLK